MDPELLSALKALSDASRLRIVGLLADGRQMTVEQLASGLGLTPGTVVHHMKRLRDAGLVESQARPPYVDYSLRLGRLSAIGAELHRLAQEAAGEAEQKFERPGWASAEDGRILKSFLDGDRLVSIPAQHAKRLVVLRFLAETLFEKKRKYLEKEVNQLLAVRHPDAASLRRYLVDEGFMSRKNSVYKLRPRKEWPRRPAGTPSEPKRQRSRANVSAETAAAPTS